MKIANLSVEMEEYSQALKDAIDASSMLFVTAAGNGGYNNDGYPAYPSSYDSPNIVSVTSVTNEGQLSAIGNYGFKSVDVAAPGDAIVTTIPTYNPGFGAEIHDPALNDKIVLTGLALSISRMVRKMMMTRASLLPRIPSTTVKMYSTERWSI